MNPTLAALRKQLREKFPTAHHAPPTPHAVPPPAFDPQNPASFPNGSITEIIPANPAAGIHLLLASILHQQSPTPPLPSIALIDGHDSFDPRSFPSIDCSKLLWVRCKSAPEVLKAADLILRDGNIPRVIIDLLSIPKEELQQLPSQSWHRLGQLVRTNNLSTIVFSPHPRVPCARHRLFFHTAFRLNHFSLSREELIGDLDLRPENHLKQAL